MNRKDFEIMAPVGSYESLHAAIDAGADAIYFGVEGLNMRSRSSVNFTLDDLREIARICTEAGVKSYLTVNTIIYDADIAPHARDNRCRGTRRHFGHHSFRHGRHPLRALPRRGGAHQHPAEREQTPKHSVSSRSMPMW